MYDWIFTGWGNKVYGRLMREGDGMVSRYKKERVNQSQRG